jgi:NAD(P)-dependent dehydrogenase (short-subunit alcohol dehydrogenase family)
VSVPVSGLLDFTGRTVVVTGGAGGLGSGIVDRFVEAGATVVRHIHRREVDDMQGVITMRADLRVTDAAERLARDVVGATGRLDVWVNNAAIQPVGDFLHLSPEEEHDVIDGSIGFVMRGTRAAARQFIDQVAAGTNSSAAVVNIASIEGLVAATGHSHYAAAKAAVLHHTRATAVELGPHGIRVNAVAPGLIDREGLVAAWPGGVERWVTNAPLTRLGQPDDVADACLFLASAAARWITGATLVVDGGMTAGNTW